MMQTLRCFVIAAGLFACTPRTQTSLLDHAPREAPRTHDSSGRLMQVTSSRSRIVRSSHILVVTAEAVTPSMPGHLQVQARLDAVYRGTLAEHAGTSHSVTLTQPANPMEWSAAPAGVWTQHQVTAGTRWVIFAESSATDLQTLMNGPACTLALPASESLADVQFAYESETASLDAASTIARAQTVITSLHPLAIDYLWARFGDAAMHDVALFERMIGVLLVPNQAYATRQTTLDTLSTAVSGAPAPRWTARLVVAMFRMLGDPSASQHHDNLISPSLPSLLGLSSALPRMTTRDVFGEHPAERDMARATLAAYRGSRDTTALRAWLWSE